MLDEERIEKKRHLPLFARVLVIKFDDKFHLIENAWPHQRRWEEVAEKSQCLLFFILEKFLWKTRNYSRPLLILCRFFIVILYLLQLPSILLKMWHTHTHTHKYCSMFLFQSRVNKFWSIGNRSMFRAQRTEMKMLLADERKFFWHYAAICFGIEASQGGKLKR